MYIIIFKMCLNCMYSFFHKCIICDANCCLKESYHTYDGKCANCFMEMPKKRRCRTCGVIFESGNKLFQHLAQNESHNKDWSYQIRREVMGNVDKCFNTWMEQYVYLGFRY